jgi:hypothetical protein
MSYAPSGSNRNRQIVGTSLSVWWNLEAMSSDPELHLGLAVNAKADAKCRLRTVNHAAPPSLVVPADAPTFLCTSWKLTSPLLF